MTPKKYLNLIVIFQKIFRCDCKPAYLYWPIEQKCYGAYKRGPCAIGEILVLDPSRNPHCVKTVCRTNEVFFNGHCQELEKHQGCEMYKNLVPRKLILTVDPTTLELACIDESEDVVCTHQCCKGRKNGSLLGKCIHTQ